MKKSLYEYLRKGETSRERSSWSSAIEEKSENHWCLIILDVVEKSRSESGDCEVRVASFVRGFARERGISLTRRSTEFLRKKELSWWPVVSFRPIYRADTTSVVLTRVCRGCTMPRLSGRREIENEKERERNKACTVHGCIAHVTQMKLKWVTKSRESREHSIPSRRLLLAFSREIKDWEHLSEDELMNRHP